MVEEKILIVDDNAEVLEKTTELLTQVGYKVICKLNKRRGAGWTSQKSEEHTSVLQSPR